MQITLASRFSGVQESATIKMAAATREEVARGHAVINFTVGEPHFPVPAAVQRAAILAIEKGFSQYTPVPGIPELRARIARKLAEENGLKYPADRIAVTCGAKQAIFNFLLAVVSPGDEVLVPAPYWTSYPEMVKLAGGEPVIVPTSPEEGFRLTPEALKRHLTRRAKALLLNSPSNPTGVVLSREEMAGIARTLEGTDVLVCSDEIYEKLVYDVPFASFGAVSEDAFARTITVNGFSKAYAMTGWRLGYAAGPKAVIDAMTVLQGQSTSGANSVAQKAAVVALDLTAHDLQPAVESLRHARDLMVKELSACRLLSFEVPQGAFYLFVDISAALGKKTPQGERIATGDDLGMYLLRQAHVGVVPGSGFGCGAYLRLSYATSDENIAAGARKIVAALESLS